MQEQEDKSSWAYIEKAIKRCKEEAKNRTKEEDEKLEEMAKHTRLWEDWSDFDSLDTFRPRKPEKQ